MTPGSGSLFDPDSAVLTNAAQWIVGTLLGTVATTICIIAIAVLGMMMFAGRIPVREGIRVLLGCFLLLGAPTIAAGLMGQGDVAPVGETGIAPERSPPVPKVRPITPFDPYAGASVPQQ